MRSNSSGVVNNHTIQSGYSKMLTVLICNSYDKNLRAGSVRGIHGVIVTVCIVFMVTVTLLMRGAVGCRGQNGTLPHRS